MTWKKWNVGYETCVQTNTLIGGYIRGRACSCPDAEKKKKT